LFFWLIYKSLAVVSAASLWTAVFRYLGFINLALAVFNLLPGFPLDGGRLFRAMLWKRSGDMDQATARAVEWGTALAWGMMALGGLEIFSGALIGGIWLIFIGLFLRSAAISGYQGTIIGHLLQRIRVGDIMTREPVTVSPDTPVVDAVERYFLKYGYGGFPVVADGRAIGALSLSQVRNCSPEDRAHKKVADIMRALDPAIEINPQVSALHAVSKMNEADSGRLVVVDNGKLVGLITRSGIMRFMQIRAELEAKTETK